MSLNCCLSSTAAVSLASHWFGAHSLRQHPDIVFSNLQVDNREVLNCYYAHADQADQLQVNASATFSAATLGRVTVAPSHRCRMLNSLCSLDNLIA